MACQETSHKLLSHWKRHDLRRKSKIARGQEGGGDDSHHAARGAADGRLRECDTIAGIATASCGLGFPLTNEACDKSGAETKGKIDAQRAQSGPINETARFFLAGKKRAGP